MSTSDLEIGSNETGGEVETCSDETGEEEEIGSDKTSKEVEPVPKRSKLRKSIAAHHRKTGISQTWLNGYKRCVLTTKLALFARYVTDVLLFHEVVAKYGLVSHAFICAWIKSSSMPRAICTSSPC